MPDGLWASGSEAESTNQRMELTAALEALKAIDGPVEVVSDSTYLVNCFRDRWWAGWLERGWRNSNKQPVANRDVWEPLIERYRGASHEVTFRWVKGHAGNEWNGIADRLAVQAARDQVGRAGVGEPDGLGEPDRLGELGRIKPEGPGKAPRGSRPAGRSWRPAGRSVVIQGLQPGSIKDPATTMRRLSEILAAKKLLHEDLIVLTGLRRGAEALGAQAAAGSGVPYVAVLPYPDPERRWPAQDRDQFAQMLDAAAGVVCLQRKIPDNGVSAAGALTRRDAWFREVADEALVVWDGDDPRVGKVLSGLEREMADDVWVVDA